MHIYKVAYNPPLSEETMAYITENVTESATSNDESARQFDLDYILASTKDELGDVLFITEEDHQFLTRLQKEEHVSFIEL